MNFSRPLGESEVRVLNPLDQPDWDDQLLALKGASFFHSWAWAKVLWDAYRYNPLYFALYGNGALQALVPVMEVKSILTGRRGVSLTFTDYCEPAVQAQEQFDHLFAVMVGQGKKRGWQTIEMRGAQAYIAEASASASYLVHELELSGDEKTLYSRFRDSTRRNIKKATAEGVTVQIDTSAASVEEFQRLNCMTRKKHGLPPQPDRFFRKVFEHVIGKGKGFTALATWKQMPVAACIYFHFGNKGLYKYGASDEAYQHLRANNLVMWEAIRWFLKNGFEHFCFGRTDPGNEGLRQFKNGWGTIEKTICYHRYDLRSAAFVPGAIELDSRYTMLFGKLPVPVLKMIGSLLYRHKG